MEFYDIRVIGFNYSMGVNDIFLFYVCANQVYLFIHHNNLENPQNEPTTSNSGQHLPVNC